MNWLLQFNFGKGAAVLAVLVLMLILERLFPKAKMQENLVRLARNFSLVTLNIVLSPLIVVPISKWASGAALAWRPDWWGGWLGLGIDLLILDAWLYVWHRLNHVVPLLWRFHEVHHLDENLDASSALRFHFGEVVLSSLVRAGVIFMLAVPFGHVVVFETMVTIAALFHHSNVRLPAVIEMPLSKLIVTPSVHWVHHHALRVDTDSNYSTMLAIWDFMFGSRSPTIRTADMPIGVEGIADRPILRLILRPFYRA